jgi:DNA-binding IclR family transcriptional regulator
VASTLIPPPTDAQDDDALPAEHDPARSSVSKALELLEILVDNPTGEVSLSELSIQVGLPKSTVHRLVSELCQHGLAGRVGVKYCPGLKLAELSARSQWSEHRDLLAVGTPVLEWLFEQAGRSTVHLGVLRGFDVVYLEKISGAGGSRIPSRVGTRLPASCTAIGKALLAANGYAEILAQGRMRGPLPTLTPYSVRDPRVLIAQLREIQTTGVVFDNGESHIGVRCVAAPVMVRNRAVAAVSVSVFGSTIKIERYAASVREAARRIAGGLA